MGRTGRVVGVEPQSHLAARARERVADEGVARYVEVVDGRGESLPVASESADVALASTVLIHLPLAAATATLREMVRVVTRNGRVAAIEQDTDTWTIDHPDRELTRRIIAFNSDQRSADGWRGRHLRRMFLEADLDTDVSTFVHVDPVEGSYLYSLGQRIATAAVAAGAVEQESADRWLALLRASARESHFFSTMNYVICVGHKERARSRVSRNSELSCPCRR